MKRNLVVGLGEILWDMLPSGKKLGGAPANFAYHVGALGLPSCAVSAVGCDPLGDEIIASLADKNIRGEIARTEHPTGTVAVTLDAAGIPSYEICRDVAWDNIPFTPEIEAIAGQTRAVCFGSLAQRSAVSRSTICRFLDALPSDTLKIFDINLRQNFYNREVLLNSLHRCNILKINDEELAIVCRTFDIAGTSPQTACCELLKRFDLQTLILTCGTNGSYIFTPTETSFLETPKVAVADTVGAGDSFTAAFTAATLSGRRIREAHTLAVSLAAHVCTQPGPTPNLPQDFKII